MLGSNDVIAFAATTDMLRARQFYEQTLGLTLVEQNDFAGVFDANGIMLRVTAVAMVSPAPYTVLGWQVTDIESVVDGLGGRGVSFIRYEGMEQDDRCIWTAPSGGRIAWFADPDGNVLSLTQFQ